MKILIINRALGVLFGGGESFDVNTAKYLSASGNKVDILSGKNLFGKRKNIYVDFDVNYIATPYLRGIAYKTQTISVFVSSVFYNIDNLLFEMSAFIWLMSKNRIKEYDVIQCCSLFTLPMLLLNITDKYVVSWLPGPPSRFTSWRISKLINKRNFKLFTHGIPQLYLEKNMSLSAGKDFSIIEPGIDLEKINRNTKSRKTARLKYSIEENVILGITVARLVPIKNHVFLLRSLAEIPKDINIKWIIVGNGPSESKLMDEVELLSLQSRVKFLGYMPQDEIYTLLNAADVFALTSIYENFSIAILEAMANRLPIICTKVGYLEHLIARSEGGISVNLGDKEALTSAIIALATDISLRRKYAVSGRKFAEQFDWSVIARKLECFYLENKPSNLQIS